MIQLIELQIKRRMNFSSKTDQNEENSGDVTQ